MRQNKKLYFNIAVISNTVQLRKAVFDTPLGLMQAVADEKVLYSLSFMDEGEKSSQTAHTTSPIDSIAAELNAYFKGQLTQFKTPIFFQGTPFQKSVWNALLQIPYGATHSYGEQAKALGKPTAYRAVANANGANKLAIIVPCHRVIQAKGTLGGYAAGCRRKQWLIDHEHPTRRV